ncbi:MAG: tetratricopeptide repeat protein [Hyphomicrobiales bacterium]|nr:tetratricopeptide repeat protein [Hyphomicrobiales bacterium]
MGARRAPGGWRLASDAAVVIARRLLSAAFLCCAVALSLASAHATDESGRGGSPTRPPAADEDGAAPLEANPALEAARSRSRQLDQLHATLLIPDLQPDAVERVVAAIESLWLQSGSPTVDLLMERALQATQQRNYALSIKVLTAVVEIAPEYAEGWNQLAVAYYLSENFDQTLPPLLRALKLERRHFKALEGFGVLMRDLGEKRAALGAFRKALSLNPHSASAREAERELARDVEGQGL